MVTTRSGRTIGNKRTKPNPKNPKVDRLSTLPDDLLLSILTHLPTKTAISTSLLSHRWQTLWTKTTHLTLTGPRPPQLFSRCRSRSLNTQTNEKFNNFISSVTHLLTRLISPKILKFHLTMRFPRHSHSGGYDYDSALATWVRNVCSRHVEDFSVILNSFRPRHPIKIPASRLFQCDSIVSLSLSDGLLYYDDNGINQYEINLPNLRKLEMKFCDLHWKKHEYLMKTLFKSCPLLEELRLEAECRMTGSIYVVGISCPTLKTLYLDSTAEEVDLEFLIDAPKLENLTVFSHSTRFRFDTPLCSLENVEWDILHDTCKWINVHLFDSAWKAFKVVSGSVRVFELNCVVMNEVCSREGEGFPVLQNLTEVRIPDFDFTKLDYLFVLLKYCPNLEVLELTMDSGPGVAERDSVWEVPEFEPVCLSTKLRVLQLRGICGSVYNLNFLEFVLSKGSVLEELIVHVRCTDDYGCPVKKKELEFRRKLFSYPRNSSVCVIKFSGKWTK